MLNQISFHTYGRQVKTKSDWHITTLAGTNRLYYIHSGSVVHTTGRTKRVLQPGKLYLFPQNLRFELLLDQQTCIDHTYFNFCSVPLLSSDDVIEVELADHPLIHSAAQVLFDLAEIKPPKGTKLEVLMRSYLNNLLALLCDAYPFRIDDDKTVNGAIAYIHAHIADKIMVSDLAEMYNFEKSAFIRKFKNHTGVTPYQYIKSHRISTALSLMDSSTLSAAEIAEKVGYADGPSLYHAVKTRRRKQ